MASVISHIPQGTPLSHCPFLNSIVFSFSRDMAFQWPHLGMSGGHLCFFVEFILSLLSFVLHFFIALYTHACMRASYIRFLDVIFLPFQIKLRMEKLDGCLRSLDLWAGLDPAYYYWTGEDNLALIIYQDLVLVFIEIGTWCMEFYGLHGLDGD